MHRRSLRLWPVCVVCVSFFVALTACETRASVARDDFSSRHSCPADRVAVIERPDLQYTPLSPEVPPPEVAADEARLSVWRQSRQDREASHRHAQSMTTVFEVSGCDARELLRCDSYEYVSCSVEDQG